MFQKKREEIRRQLLADMEAEIEQGVPLDVVMIRMGEPIAIAEEFNQNLPQQERRQYQRGRIKKQPRSLRCAWRHWHSQCTGFCRLG